MKNTDKTIIKLKKPITVDGVPFSSLEMREPTVADQLAAQKQTGTDAEQELAMIANLCMVKPEDLHQLTLRDYRAVQEAFAGFFD